LSPGIEVRHLGQPCAQIARHALNQVGIIAKHGYAGITGAARSTAYAPVAEGPLPGAAAMVMLKMGIFDGERLITEIAQPVLVFQKAANDGSSPHLGRVQLPVQSPLMAISRPFRSVLLAALPVLLAGFLGVSPVCREGSLLPRFGVGAVAEAHSLIDNFAVRFPVAGSGGVDLFAVGHAVLAGVFTLLLAALFFGHATHSSDRRRYSGGICREAGFR
jgi:hypothetical protein